VIGAVGCAAGAPVGGGRGTVAIGGGVEPGGGGAGCAYALVGAKTAARSKPIVKRVL
jgi:hypothetical protein